MNFKFYLGFFSTIFILLSSGVNGQEFIQICSEPESLNDCVFSNEEPDYKNPKYSYVIVRDTFAVDVVKIGKQLFDNSPGARTDLLLDIYLPCNYEESRPVVFIPEAHGYSSEFSKTNLDNTSDYRYLLKEFARRGYVAITYEYRTYTRIFGPNFYFDISPQENNGATLDSCAYMAFVNGSSTETNNFYRCYSCMVNAGEQDEADALYKLMVYNQKQDVFAAINYAIEDPLSLGLNIDMNNVFTTGISNGSQVALANAYLDPSDFSDNLGNLISSLYGEFNSVGLYDHIPNDFEFKGVAGLWGSISDLNWIDENDPSAMLIHGTWDDKVAFQSNYIGFAQYGDSTKFWTNGSENVACKLLAEDIQFGLISVKKGIHGFWQQLSPCEPKTVCGYAISDDIIDRLLLTFKYLYFNGSGGNYVENFSPALINCNTLVQNEYPIDYLIGTDSIGQCVPDPLHSIKNMPELNEYCNCYNPSPQQASLFNQEQLKFFQFSDELELFPNPVSDIITIKSAERFSQGIIYDLNGRVVQSFSTKEEKKIFELNVTSLRSGIYLLSIGNESKRFIKTD